MADPKPKKGPLTPPPPTASENDITAYLERVDVETAISYLEENANSWDSTTFDRYANMVALDPIALDAGTSTRLLELRERKASLESDAQEQIEFASGNGVPLNQDLDGDGSVSPEEASAFAGARPKVVAGQREAAEEGGATPEQADQVASDTDAQLDGIMGGYEATPGVILEYTGGRLPSIQQQQELLAAWNQYNPDEPIGSYRDLERIVNDRPSDPMVRATLEAGFLGVEPQIAYTISTGGAKITIDEVAFRQFQQSYGAQFDSKDLTTFVRWAAQLGISDTQGRNGWQVVAALAKYAGITDPTVTVPDVQRAGPNGEVINAGQRSAAQATQAANGRRVTQLATKFKAGLQLYGGNQTLAFVSAVNPQLAMRVSATRPENWSQRDMAQFNQILLTGGFDRAQLQAMGYYALGLDEWNGPGGGRYIDPEDEAAKRRAEEAANAKQFPDPVAVKQAARDFYLTLFAEEPTEQQLEQFAGVVSSAINSSADNVNVDPQARIRDAARGTAKYRELYGAKPAGMSEEEYQQQFRNGAASILGGAAPDPSVIQAGMRTGKYQTTVGAAAGSAGSFENSTFMGRLAQAAQVVSEST